MYTDHALVGGGCHLFLEEEKTIIARGTGVNVMNKNLFVNQS